MEEVYSSYESEQIRTLLEFKHTFSVGKISNENGAMYMAYLDGQPLWGMGESEVRLYLVGFLHAIRELYGE